MGANFLMLSQLSVSHFRNLSSVEISPSEKFNVLFGKNGSGKTSLLEAVYYLNLARSFRSHINSHVIQKDKERLSLFGKILGNSVGLERSKDGGLKVKVNFEEISHISELAKIFPIQLINSDSFELIHGSSKTRRQFLDFGLFHVKRDLFFKVWKKLQQVLAQRNGFLRNEKNLRTLKNELAFWNKEFVSASHELHELRKEYFEEFLILFFNVLEPLLQVETLNLAYYPGWTKERSLADSLEEDFRKDCALGYTQSGAHRADIKVTVNGIPAKDILSRGQQKLTVCAMLLAQSQLLEAATGEKSVFLVDDLASELDENKREMLVTALKKTKSQVFMTGVDKELFREVRGVIKDVDMKLFHVEQGTIKEIPEQI
ncbi:MAG: DNA replication/repair protein RecF [Gammaproteobacteria bacterium]|nr:DNA replication/repair protein RecF [Gammaproteobacteria bacterium]MBU2546669.1 DNA replication/repair protein RecF [Gammaproteobacteria bacterium]